MFWANNYMSSPNIEALLNKENVTLHELMDEEDILQECKGQNKKLIEYLARSDVMEELISLTTREPSTDVEERWRYRYPNIACELLTCDVPLLNEKLAGNETLLAKLYSFIDTDQPLNPLLASFFSKTIGVLIGHKTVQNWYSYQFTCLQLLAFLKSRQTCVDLLLRHLETSAIMDLVLKLVSQVEGNMRQHILNWLDGQRLVQRLIHLMSPDSEPSRHANAAQLLCDMVTAARENRRTSTARNGPDPILNALESPDTVALILETVLARDGRVESSVVGGIQVLLTLFPKANDDSGTNEGNSVQNGVEDEGGAIDSAEDRIKMSSATLPYFERLHRLLTDPPYKPPVKTTLGVLDCPVGITRLHVAKLFVTLMATDNVKVYETLMELGTFQTLLDLFFRYVWNNFLHTQVQCCLALAVNCDFKETNDVIYDNIFTKCRLIERILEACDRSDAATENEKNENDKRQGYMGHLINIANNIVNRRERSERLDKFFKDNLSPECLSKWDNFVDTELAKVNKTHRILLGGKAEVMMGSADNPDDYSSYPQDFLQVQRVEQFYSNYLGQHMTPQFTESFGFHDEQFNDGDDVLPEEDLDKSEDMFTKICQQKQKADLEDGNAGAEWGADEGDLTFQTVVDKRDWPSKQQQQQQQQRQLQQQQNDSNSSDDEEDDETRVVLMDIQSFPKLSAEKSYSFSGLASTRHWDVDPWDVAPSAEPVESTGWANFDNFENTLHMENTVIIRNNKICNVSKKEQESYAESVVENETTIATTATTTTTTTDTAAVDSVKIPAAGTVGEAGDTKVEDSIDRSTASPPRVETDLCRPTEIADVDESGSLASRTSDKNANPNEVVVDPGREIKCEGSDVENVESTETTVQSEIRPSSERKDSFSEKRNEIPEAAAVDSPSTDAAVAK